MFVFRTSYLLFPTCLSESCYLYSKHFWPTHLSLRQAPVKTLLLDATLSLHSAFARLSLTVAFIFDIHPLHFGKCHSMSNVLMLIFVTS
jgi:hypothetical protein